MNQGVFNTLRTSGKLVMNAGEVFYDIGDSAVSMIRSAKDDVIDPIADGIDDAIGADIDDVIPSGLDSAIKTALVGDWDTAYRNFTDYSVKDMIKDVMPGVDSVDVSHGRRSRLSGYDPRYRYPQEIALTKTSEEALERQNLFTFFDDTDGIRITADEISYQEGTNPYIKGMNPLEWMRVGRIDSPMSHSDGPIYGPFSKFTPTALWPWQTKEGARMTAAELAEVPLDGDWLGTKPIAEAVLGQKLDKVGGMPGYRFYGDAVLGAPIIGGGVLLVLASPLWIPVVSAIGTSLLGSAVSLGRGVAKALG